MTSKRERWGVRWDGVSFRWRHLVGALFAFAALLFLGYVITNNFEDFQAAILSLSLGQVALGLGLAIIIFLLQALYHVFLCERLSGASGLAAEVMPAYCMAQFVRYLPGKVWGVVYQANRLSGQLHPGDVVTANAIQTITTHLLGTGVIVSILASVYMGAFWPLGGIVLAVLVTEFVHRNPLLEGRLLVLAYRIFRRQDPPQNDIPPQPFVGTLILLLEWAAYFALWFVVVGATLGPLETITLAAWYAAASLLAVVAVAVPAGLAVREALFVAFGSFTVAGAAALVGLAAALRLLFTLGELACIPIAEFVGKRLRKGRT